MTLRRRARVLLITSAALAVCSSSLASAAAPGTNVLVSRPSAFGPLATPTTNDSTVSGGEGAARVVSDDNSHRYVAFSSDADGLSDADDDRFTNVFVRDRALGVTTLVSRAGGPAGAGADGDSSEPSISANGRFVAFQSSATNIAAGATGDAVHVYVRDLLSGTTELVDRADGPEGVLANNSSFDPALTVTGGGNPVVAFTSAATNLDGATVFSQVYVRAGSDTEMISRPDGSTTIVGNEFSGNPSISTDATRVGFESSATNLGDAVSGDDVLVRTLATNDTALVAAGGNGDSRDPSLSGDGNEIAFTSTSSQLVPAVDANTRRDVYKRTMSPSSLVVISRAGGGGAVGNKESSQPSISDDGAVVAFASPSDTLTPSDTNAFPDVFIGSGTATALVSRPQNGVESNGGSGTPSMARAPGNAGLRVIAFTTAADNMGAEDEDDFTQVYGRFVGAVIAPNPAFYVSRASGVEPFRSGVNASFLRSPLRDSENAAVMSQDGRFTVFLSAEDDLAPDDDDRLVNVYRRDNLTGETLLVSRADGFAGAAANDTSGTLGGGILLSSAAPSGSPSISADGNRVAFASAATNLVAGDSNSRPDVFVRDVAAGSTVLASRDAAGAVITASSSDPAISGDGRRVAFVTSAPVDLMDGNGNFDVYMRDLDAGDTQLVSRKGANGPAGDDGSTMPAIDADGSHVAFATDADDFSAITDLNNAVDVWVRDLVAEKVTLVSYALGADAMGDKSSDAPAISADGNRIAFASLATDLVGPADVNGAGGDVFVRDVAAATTTLVSRTAGQGGISGNSFSDRPSIDASGTRVAFETFANDLVPGDVNGAIDVLLRDTVADTTELVSSAQGVGGAQAAESSGTASISGNGDCVAFQSSADGFVAMPPGTDHQRVVARAVRGDCPFGPLPSAAARRPAARIAGDARHDEPGPLRRQHRPAPLPARQAREAAHPQAAADRGADPLHAVGGGDRDDPDRRAAPGAAAEEALRRAAPRSARAYMQARGRARHAHPRRERRCEPREPHRPAARQAPRGRPLPGHAQGEGRGGQRLRAQQGQVHCAAPDLT